MIRTKNKAAIMKTRVLILSIISLLNVYCQNIEIIFTSALIAHQFEIRKEEYLKSYTTLIKNGFTPWIIESTNIDHSFYDELTSHICYPQKNNPTVRNIGVNEVMALKTSIPFLPFNDDDIVIKLTGRYLLYEQTFIDTIRENPNNDAYAKWVDDQVFTGCIALKWKYFKNFLQTVNLAKMEKEMINLEKELAHFIIEKNLKCFIIDHLHIKARIYANGKGNTTYNY